MPRLLDRLTGRQGAWEPLPEDSAVEQFFTDAKYAIRAFEELVSVDPFPKRLMIVHGVGGVGKSTLLRMLRLACYRRGMPVVLVAAEDTPSSLHVLETWAEDLERMGLGPRELARTLEEYRALQVQVEAKASEELESTADRISKAAARTAVEMATGTIPVIGPLAAPLSGAATEAAVDWLRGVLRRPDLELYLDPGKRLTEDFLNDLTSAGERHRIVLMVDTYEQMNALDSWMCDLARRLPANVLLAIAGRAMPNWDRAWPGWMGQAQIVALEEMTPDDQRTLVRRYYAYIRGGEPDPDQVAAIVQFARGLPIAVTTVVQLWVKYGLEDFYAVKAQVVADLADRLLEGVPTEMRPAFEAAAILRYFNTESLQALLDEEDTEALHAELRRWPFVRPRRAGLSVHDTMREMMNEALQMRAPHRFRALNKQAAKYYEALIEEATGDERERLTLERLYHCVCSDEETGMQLFQKVAEELVNYWLVNHLRALLNDANTYPMERENSRLWRKYYNARLAHLEARLADAERVYQVIGENEHAEPRLRAYALCDWGQLLSYYERVGQPDGVERATSTLEQSLNLVPLDFHLVRGFFHLARVQRYQAKWDEQTALLQKAREFFEERQDEYGLAYACSEIQRGFASRGLWRDMLTIQEELEALSHRFPESTALKSRVMRWHWSWALTGRLYESEKKARESESLVRSLDDTVSLFHVLRDLGWILGYQERYVEAERSFAESLRIAQGLGKDYRFLVGSVLGFWGAVLTRQQEIDRANEHLSKSLGIREQLRDTPAVLQTLVWLGRLYELQQNLDQARDYYTRCLDWRDSGQNYFYSEALIGLMRVEHGQSDYATIPPLSAKADQLAQKYEYNDHLASLQLAQGHITWEGKIPEWGSSVEGALPFYQQALIYALRYNRFLLDEVLCGGDLGTPLRPIIPHCLLQDGEGGRQMLTALRDWWRTGYNDIGTPRADTISPIPEGIPLLEAERIARSREPGDGMPQMSVIRQIEQALNTEL